MEPDAYITDLDGELLVSREGTDHKVRVGTVSAYSVHLGEAYEDGVPWFDVLDARSGEAAMYIDLFELSGSCYSEWVEHNLCSLFDSSTEVCDFLMRINAVSPEVNVNAIWSAPFVRHNRPVYAYWYTSHLGPIGPLTPFGSPPGATRRRRLKHLS